MKKLMTILAMCASTAAAEDAYVDFQTLTIDHGAAGNGVL